MESKDDGEVTWLAALIALAVIAYYLIVTTAPGNVIAAGILSLR